MSQAGFSIKLSNVKIEEVTFKEPNKNFINNFKESNLNTGLGINFSLDVERELLFVYLSIFYDYNENEQLTQQLLNFQGSFEFHISNLKNNIEQEEDSFKVPDNVMERLTDISISSARGIIIAKTAGSFVNKFYLPIFDAKMVLQDIKKQGSGKK